MFVNAVCEDGEWFHSFPFFFFFDGPWGVHVGGIKNTVLLRKCENS